ncbi:uncharacterized protein MELLADRAFT_123600 [Melampsora larici-populina 98AG31]|uniref:Secreted protein n=1 Tax=Melampsora larici-populina (strain 98AG31 / pathotype 3-4-7) TaxID=747676 RepID=F4RNN8_MELLP|nr:uncharacterized protein MELLADRAFT_123600 [Melampsora larici-populina 98AG31]EGG06061.1 secreted protein [Melampsora larici-populina 98AG31]
MNSKFTFLLIVLQFMSTITIISGAGITCDELFRGPNDDFRCVSSSDGMNNDCESCTNINVATGEYCVLAYQEVPKGTQIPNQDTPKVIKNGNCNNFESLTLNNAPYGYGCAAGPNAPQTLFCNAIIKTTIPSCEKCKQRGKRSPEVIIWKN